MKESPTRYVNPFLSDEENEKVNLWNDAKVNLTTKDDKLGKSLDYIDKDVTECKMPELITCYDDSGFHVVKDICVDEGGLSHEKNIEIDNDDLHKLSSENEQQLRQSPLEDCNKKTDIISVNGDVNLSSDYEADELKLFVESNTVKKSEICGRDTSMETGDAKLGSCPISLENQDQLLKSVKVVEPSNNDVDRKLYESTGSEVDKSDELNKKENTDSNADNVKPVTVIGPRELLIDTQTAPNHHDMAPDNIPAANQLQRGGGESSFSVADSVSGLITYSGPITSAGSISHRSDASNTSVRSFAFPILQNEWNTSPVRMAKVDQRRKQRGGWKQALLCCGF